MLLLLVTTVQLQLVVADPLFAYMHRDCEVLRVSV